MIYDTLSSIGRYSCLGERFKLGFDYLRENHAANRPDGQVAIAGNDVYAVHESYVPKHHSKLKWEAHRIYADIHFFISGEEHPGHSFIDRMKLTEPYNEKEECAFFEGEGRYLRCVAGDFVVFLPHDVHMPQGTALANPSMVRKILIKVRV